MRVLTLVESNEFTRQLVELGDPEEIAWQIRGLLWGISRNPEQFDKVPGVGVRFAKSKPFVINRTRQRLYIFFVDHLDQVELLYLTTVAIE